MAFNYQRGDFVPVVWSAVPQRPGGGAGTGQALVIPFVVTTLLIKSHTLDITALVIDVSNSGLGGVRARIHGIDDYEGTVNLSLDLDLNPWGAPFIVAGWPGICSFGVSPVRFIQVPVIIEKTSYSSAVDKEVQYTIGVKGNSLAGVVIYPPTP